MSIVSALVLYAVIWFLVLFVVLPIRLETQGDRGEIVPGTHAGAPANLNMRKKARLVSLIAAGIWAVAAATILSGVISLESLDVFRNLRPQPDGTGG
ncbi:MAG: DUF1467 family protein [Pseudomonadota bacterium]